MTPITSPLSSLVMLVHTLVLVAFAVYGFVRPILARILRTERKVLRGIVLAPSRFTGLLNPLRYFERA